MRGRGWLRGADVEVEARGDELRSAQLLYKVGLRSLQLVCGFVAERSAHEHEAVHRSRRTGRGRDGGVAHLRGCGRGVRGARPLLRCSGRDGNRTAVTVRQPVGKVP